MEKIAYCLYHNKFLTDKSIKPKCLKSRYKAQRQCKHLIILKGGVISDGQGVKAVYGKSSADNIKKQ